MNKNIKSILTDKEFEIVQAGTRANVKMQSEAALKKYIRMTRALRDKYHALVDLHKGSNRHWPYRRIIEKAHIFDVVLGRYEKQYRETHT